jgi:membrane protein
VTDRLKALFQLIDKTIKYFNQANGPMLAAALAYYTIFSIPPLLVISISVAGLFIDETVLNERIYAEVSLFFSAEAAEFVQLLVDNSRPDGSGTLTMLISIVLAFLGASYIFVMIKSALNQIWGRPPMAGRELLVHLRTRLLAFVGVLIVGAFLLVFFAISIFLTLAYSYVRSALPIDFRVVTTFEFLIVLLIFTTVFAIIFKTMPEIEIAWRDVWIGAGVTALIFIIGEYAIGFYLGQANIGLAYGLASSVIVFLFWAYISAQIFLFGAAFTRAYATTYGSKQLN